LRTVRALPRAAGALAVALSVEAIERDGGAVTGVRTSAGAIGCDQVVIAAGPWSAAPPPFGEGPPVRPVKGQIIELRTRAAMANPFERVLRTPRCYLVS